MNQEKSNMFSSKALDYFLQIAETMNYTKAAQILGISQPALTQQIKKIEKKIGAPLFYSSGKKLYLTDVGYLFLQMTHSVNTIFDNTAYKIQKTINSNNGEIKIGLLSSIEDKVFTDFISTYYKKNPDIKVTLYKLNRDDIWNKLENNLLDLAIMYLPDHKIENWQSYVSKKIIDEELMFLHHKVDKLNQNSIKLSETNDEKWTLYPDTYYVNELLREEFKNQLTNLPSISAYLTTPEQLYRFSKTTNSYTALPRSFIETKIVDIGSKVLSFDPKIVFQLSYVYRFDKEQVPRIINFLDFFTIYLEEENYYSRLKKNFSE
ncbi:LysR substrate-binding domain-containing protein [Carnobacterium sp. TMP28]|uniref:LysR family transcriptional regulator n=1 Tax=Carnobacterium sp. TMP28 TaxID=3397060 RepID=UPI0039E145D9